MSKNIQKFVFGNLETGETRVLTITDDDGVYSLLYKRTRGPKVLKSFSNSTDAGFISIVGSGIISNHRRAGDEVEKSE